MSAPEPTGNKASGLRNVFAPGLLEGKVALVAGGSSGINLVVAEWLARAGAVTALLSRDAGRIESAAQRIVDAGGNARGYAVDVRDDQAVDATVQMVADNHGQIDIVVSGAAGNFVAAASEMSGKGFRTVVDIDLNGTFHVLRACYSRLRRPGASIVNVSAPQARVPYPMQAHVSAAKAGVEMLTRSLAVEWGPSGVRVNAVVPGPVAETEGMKRLAPGERATELVANSVPLRRFAAADEIAALVLFLVTDAGSYVNGAIIPCDGGISLMGPEAFGAAHAA